MPAGETFLLSMVTASVSFAVTEAKLLLRVREWAKNKHGLLGDLFCCGYCFGHWVALVLVAAYRPRLFETWWPLDYALTILVIAWMAAFQWAAMCWLMDKAERKPDDLHEEL